MVNVVPLSVLKQILLREVRYLCRRTARQWNEPVVQTIQEIREVGSRAVFFGGTLRSLLISRVFGRKPGRPRDLDIVVAGASLAEMRKRFNGYITRETRFGGLSMQRRACQFDVWPLDRTWRFVHDEAMSPAFSALPHTTFLNLEAVAVDVWPAEGGRRLIYSGDEQFFCGIWRRTLEVNNAENPFPELCVVRSLVMAASTEFKIGPRLAQYIAEFGVRLSQGDIGDIQHKHYGSLRYDPGDLHSWIRSVASAASRKSYEPIHLPGHQLVLWEEYPLAIRVHVLEGTSSIGEAK